jgi:hypothetical protein
MEHTPDGRLSTGVYHDDREVAIRARSQHSRDAHIPTTDADGTVTFSGGEPVPECGVDPHTDTEWVLRAVDTVSNRGTCRRCFDADDVAAQNATNGGSPSFARRRRYGESWGTGES